MNPSPFVTIVKMLVYLGVLGLAVQAFIGLSFLISSVWEKERRAAAFAAAQFAGMAALLIIYLLLIGYGFFETTTGLAMLIAGYIMAVLAAIFLVNGWSLGFF